MDLQGWLDSAADFIEGSLVRRYSVLFITFIALVSLGMLLDVPTTLGWVGGYCYGCVIMYSHCRAHYKRKGA